MSAAPEFPPVVFIPERARGHRPALRRPNRFTVVPPHSATPGLGPVDDELSTDWSAPVWHRASLASAVDAAPALLSVPAGVRLTRRGAVVVAMLVVAAATIVGVIAWSSAGSAGRVANPAAGSAPAAVSVHPGDTLWSIAAAVAPTRDPRAEVDVLTRLNHLGGNAALTPGQVLRTR